MLEEHSNDIEGPSGYWPRDDGSGYSNVYAYGKPFTSLYRHWKNFDLSSSFFYRNYRQPYQTLLKINAIWKKILQCIIYVKNMTPQHNLKVLHHTWCIL